MPPLAGPAGPAVPTCPSGTPCGQNNSESPLPDTTTYPAKVVGLGWVVVDVEVVVEVEVDVDVDVVVLGGALVVGVVVSVPPVGVCRDPEEVPKDDPPEELVDPVWDAVLGEGDVPPDEVPDPEDLDGLGELLRLEPPEGCVLPPLIDTDPPLESSAPVEPVPPNRETLPPPLSGRTWDEPLPDLLEDFEAPRAV